MSINIQIQMNMFSYTLFLHVFSYVLKEANLMSIVSISDQSWYSESLALCELCIYSMSEIRFIISKKI